MFAATSELLPRLSGEVCMCSNRTCKPASYGSGILHCGQASLIAYHPTGQLAPSKGQVVLTHEWSTVFEVLLVVGNTIAGQMVAGEIESISSPEITLNFQLITPVIWDVAYLISMFGKRDDYARWLIRKLECCLSARNEWL